MKRLRTLLVLAGMAVLFVGCKALIADDQAAVMISKIDALEQAGHLTPVDAANQRAVIVDATKDRTIDNILWTLAAIAGSILGVNVQRGTPGNRKGLPPRSEIVTTSQA